MQYGRLIDAALQAKSERYVAEIFAGCATSRLPPGRTSRLATG